MRVYEKITYNLKDIKFKETKGYIDGLLAELGIGYTDIAFLFTGDSVGTICNKAIKQIPTLAPYYHICPVGAKYSQSPEEHWLASTPDGFYIDPSHTEAFFSLLQKVPHAVNFPDMNVILDNINWYEGEAPSPGVFSSHWHPFDYSLYSYTSNSIRLRKEFDYGSKQNPVEIYIDRTGETGDLRPYPKALESLIAKLGKPKHKWLHCVFTEEEEEVLKQADARMKESYAHTDVSSLFAGFEVQDVLPATPEGLLASVTPVSGFSPKAVLSQAGKPYKMRYVSAAGGCYQLRKRNANGHYFTVEFMAQPMSKVYWAYLRVHGHNFSHHIYTTPHMIATEETMEAFAKAYFEAIGRYEENHANELLEAYGPTPEWYQ
jgi:hypothetical protein